jgi:hypothetical protein
VCLEGSIIKKFWLCRETYVLMKLLKLILGRVEWAVCSATWILGTTCAFALGPIRPRETLIQLAVGSTLRMHTDLRPVVRRFKYTTPSGSPYAWNLFYFWKLKTLSQRIPLFIWTSKQLFTSLRSIRVYFHKQGTFVARPFTIWFSNFIFYLE